MPPKKAARKKAAVKKRPSARKPRALAPARPSRKKVSAARAARAVGTLAVARHRHCRREDQADRSPREAAGGEASVRAARRARRPWLQECRRRSRRPPKSWPGAVAGNEEVRVVNTKSIERSGKRLARAAEKEGKRLAEAGAKEGSAWPPSG